MESWGLTTNDVASTLAVLIAQKFGATPKIIQTAVATVMDETASVGRHALECLPITSGSLCPHSVIIDPE